MSLVSLGEEFLESLASLGEEFLESLESLVSLRQHLPWDAQLERRPGWAGPCSTSTQTGLNLHSQSPWWEHPRPRKLGL